MPCRVGITTDALSCRMYWDERVVSLRNWLVVSTHDNKMEALRAGAEYREKSGCIAQPAEDGPLRAEWSVYRFTYDDDVHIKRSE